VIMRNINKLLVANRGEIACRIIATAKKLHIKSVAVYSDADRHGRHVAMADEAIYIGPADAAESYLNAPRLLEAAKQSGADAIHPGYGFLSENANFSRLVHQADLIFVGPRAEAMEAMGSKQAAKRLMESAGVPIVPGYHGEDQDAEVLLEKATATGYPLLIKATAGGGGKGMRIVLTPEDFIPALEAARREAKAAFSDDRVLLERYLPEARHIELQIFRDAHGNTLHLFERDCSLQRRHQKVIEEAPAPGLPDTVRKEMAKAAINAADAINYLGAGTVEFIVDSQFKFYFMEMNTRLQVEHPVTEMVTGLDLVELQLMIADGSAMPLAQADISIRGHAIEARLYAEDPARQFLPAAGRLDRLRFPKAVEFESEQHSDLRVDAGVQERDQVSIQYDPMIAKIVSWGINREAAIRRLAQALANTEIDGITTNLKFLYTLLNTSVFHSGNMTTAYIDHALEGLIETMSAPPSEEQLAIAALCELMAASSTLATSSPWDSNDAWTPNIRRQQQVCFTAQTLSGTAPSANNDKVTISILAGNDDAEVSTGAQTFQMTCKTLGENQYQVGVADRLFQVVYYGSGQSRHIHFPSIGQQFQLQLASLWEDEDTAIAAGGLIAPMPGNVLKVLTTGGAEVNAGDALMILEAMKMEHVITAPEPGTVTAIFFKQGDSVNEGDPLLTISTDESKPEEKAEGGK